ncbi:S8 family peptidase [Peribacillus loiseleuriae]|uniref:SLH domain-containing protein n=1 Tax=Peribacillus loiseleuriae TaxID=1679170 RepID=A0A0K9GZ28_9BACI|nr:S8 family serine peptidase [Peribacillus loiseleuriae]KMY51918.1 hypothetical protein AC625_22295 [Peribacillus loiseleuriae]
MKKVLFILSFCILLIVPLQVAAADEAEPLMNQRVIVGFHHEIDLSILEGIPFEMHHQYDEIKAISITIPYSSLVLLKENPKVAWVERDQIVKTNGQVVDWGHEPVGVAQSRKAYFTGEGVKVAVIDTGISMNHPDLAIAGGVTFVENTTSYNDDNGHGTHVAGIIGAKDNDIGVVGVAPDAELYAIKVLAKDGEGNQTDVIAGIEWAIQHDIDIINLSITSPIDSITLRKVLERADEQGIIVTAASGNEENGIRQPIGSDIMFPARYPTVIAVGSINKQLHKSAFSYFGPSLDYTAPGEDIYSTYIIEGEQKTGYTSMSGTSMATPYVTGTIALYKQAYPTLTMHQLKKAMQQKAIDLGEKGKDPYYGYGLIQSPTTLFLDVKNDVWYSSYMQYLLEAGFISGYLDGTFKPNGYITREEAVTMIGRALHLDGEERRTDFTDVKPDSFGSGYIAAASEQGFINGYPNQTFEPKSLINRGDVALVIQQAFHIPQATKQIFQDVKREKYYFEAVNALSGSKIIGGYPDGNFSPEQKITRAEFSIVLAKALNESFR